jgi:hypothetical protein
MKIIIGNIFKVVGFIMIMFWFAFQGYFYFQMWGVAGFFIGFIGAIPLTFYTFFLWILSSQFLEILVSLVYLAVSLILFITSYYLLDK